MSRYFLHLAYDGTHYCGWQVQPKVITVQQTIEKALRILLPELKCIIGCGRTDTGVHASSYYAHFDTKSEVPENIVYKLNAILPLDIAIYDCFEVASNLHARFAATMRSYDYHIHYRKDPFKNHYSVYQGAELDVEKMNAACQYLLGTHDFSSFSKSRTQTSTNICEIKSASWQPIDHGAVFSITANRFLRNMVRAIAGTMFMIGENKMTPEALQTVINSMQRSEAGKSAHPQGLFLTHIEYPAFHGTSIR